MKKIMTVLAIAAVLITAVTATGLADQPKTAKAYENLRKQMEGVSKNTSKYNASLKKTMQSLSKVTTADPKNLGKSVKSFQKEVDGLNKDLKNATDGIKSLREKRSQYLADWDRSIQSISDPDLKKASEERKKAVTDNHEKLTKQATELREKIDGFMKELADLQTFLGSDPTTGAVSAAKPKIDKVLSDGNSLETSIQEVTSKLNAFAKGSA
jgi:chromosome segregation ATPase